MMRASNASCTYVHQYRHRERERERETDRQTDRQEHVHTVSHTGLWAPLCITLHAERGHAVQAAPSINSHKCLSYDMLSVIWNRCDANRAGLWRAKGSRVVPNTDA